MKDTFKDQLAEELRLQADLKAKLHNLEDDKFTLEQQLETGFKMAKSNQKIKDVNMARQKQLLLEKAKKEREEMKR